jgi:hypothetical protein
MAEVAACAVIESAFILRSVAKQRVSKDEGGPD